MAGSLSGRFRQLCQYVSPRLPGCTALGGLNLYQFRKPCPPGDFLDVTVDDLAGQVRNLVIVFLQNGKSSIFER